MKCKYCHTKWYSRGPTNTAIHGNVTNAGMKNGQKCSTLVSMGNAQAIENRIREWRDNAIDNARHHNDLAENFAKEGRADLARIYNRRAWDYLAQVNAYEDVLTLF